MFIWQGFGNGGGFCEIRPGTACFILDRADSRWIHCWQKISQWAMHIVSLIPHLGMDKKHEQLWKRRIRKMWETTLQILRGGEGRGGNSTATHREDHGEAACPLQSIMGHVSADNDTATGRHPPRGNVAQGQPTHEQASGRNCSPWRGAHIGAGCLTGTKACGKPTLEQFTPKEPHLV